MNRSFVFAALLSIPAGLVATSASAHACAMRRIEPVVVAANDLVAAKNAEKKGDVAKALKLYEKAMMARGDNARAAEAALAAARLHTAGGDASKAVARLNRAVALQPRHAQARLALAEALAADRPEQAAEHLAVAQQVGVRGAERKRMVAVQAAITAAQAAAQAQAQAPAGEPSAFPAANAEQVAEGDLHL